MDTDTRVHEALYEARNALQQNLDIWKQDAQAEKWCQTKNALGGVSWRLSQFDVPENAMSHLAEAKGHYEDVRALCSEEFLPKDLRDRQLRCGERVFRPSTGEIRCRNTRKILQFALSLQLSALRFFSKSKDAHRVGHPAAQSGVLLHQSLERADRRGQICDRYRAMRSTTSNCHSKSGTRRTAFNTGWRLAGRSERLF